MNILITGATGFIGSHLAKVLQLAGHRVRCCMRHHGDEYLSDFDAFEVVTVDFERALTAADWLPHLHGIDAVINAVGIFSESAHSKFATVHDKAPCALFAACNIANISRVVQISALGAALDADTEFLRSKARADAFLFKNHFCGLVLQPSLVFGRDGASSGLFVKLASLPVIILPEGGTQQIQPVHIDDIGAAVLQYLDSALKFPCGAVAAVGPRPLTVRAYIDGLRTELGRKLNRVISIPSKKLAALSQWLPLPWLQADALHMLQRGNCADVHAFATLLKREPRGTEQFGTDIRAINHRQHIQIAINVLRASMALLWIITGIISLGIFPVEEGAALLARAGIGEALKIPLLYAAGLFDIAMGIAVILIHRAWIGWVQAVVIIFYSLVIAFKLPEFWVHPFAPLLKNIPLLAAIYLIGVLDVRSLKPREPRRNHVRIR